MADFSYGTYKNYAPYVYDENGKTIGFKLKESNGREVYSSQKALDDIQSLGKNYVSKSINGEEWILFEEYENTDINEAKRVEDFSVDELTNLFLAGNLTWFEYGRGLEANGATDIHCTGGEGGASQVTMSFYINGKFNTFSCKYDKSVSQIDDNNIKDMAADYKSRITISQTDKIEEAPGGMVKYAMWDVYQQAAQEFIYTYFGYIPRSAYDTEPLTDEQKRFVNANPQIFHYGYDLEYGECLTGADKVLTQGIDEYLLHKAQLEEDICAYGNRLYCDNMSELAEKCKQGSDSDPIYSLSYKKLRMDDGSGQFIQTVEFTDETISAIMSALNDSDTSKSENICKVFGLTRDDSEETVRVRIQNFCVDNGSKDGKTIYFNNYHKALAKAGIEGIKSHDDCYTYANANCMDLESYKCVKADEAYYNTLYATKGGYDMFGNGNPPGPNGSIPLGDGKYIKYEMSEEDALAQGYLKIDVSDSRVPRYAIVYTTDSNGNITNEQKIQVNEVPLSFVVSDPYLGFPHGTTAVLKSMARFDNVYIDTDSISGNSATSTKSTTSVNQSNNIETKLPEGAVPTDVPGVCMKCMTQEQYRGNYSTGNVTSHVVYYVWNNKTESYDIAGASDKETYPKTEKEQKEKEILEKANNALKNGILTDLFDENYLANISSYGQSDTFTKMLVYTSGMSFTTENGIIAKDGEFYQYSGASQKELVNAIKAGKSSEDIINLLYNKVNLSSTPNIEKGISTQNSNKGAGLVEDYLYNKANGQTVAVKVNSEEGRHLAESGKNYTVKTIMNNEWFILDESIPEENMDVIEYVDLDVNGLISLFTSGNLTTEEFMKGLKAHGIEYPNGYQNDRGLEVSFIYNGQEYRVTNNIDNVKYQTDETVATLGMSEAYTTKKGTVQDNVTGKFDNLGITDPLVQSWVDKYAKSDGYGSGILSNLCILCETGDMAYLNSALEYDYWDDGKYNADNDLAKEFQQRFRDIINHEAGSSGSSYDAVKIVLIQCGGKVDANGKWQIDFNKIVDYVMDYDKIPYEGGILHKTFPNLRAEKNAMDEVNWDYNQIEGYAKSPSSNLNYGGYHNWWYWEQGHPSELEYMQVPGLYQGKIDYDDFVDNQVGLIENRIAANNISGLTTNYSYSTPVPYMRVGLDADKYVTITDDSIECVQMYLNKDSLYGSEPVDCATDEYCQRFGITKDDNKETIKQKLNAYYATLPGAVQDDNGNYKVPFKSYYLALADDGVRCSDCYFSGKQAFGMSIIPTNSVQRTIEKQNYWREACEKIVDYGFTLDTIFEAGCDYSFLTTDSNGLATVDKDTLKSFVSSSLSSFYPEVYDPKYEVPMVEFVKALKSAASGMGGVDNLIATWFNEDGTLSPFELLARLTGTHPDGGECYVNQKHYSEDFVKNLGTYYGYTSDKLFIKQDDGSYVMRPGLVYNDRTYGPATAYLEYLELKSLVPGYEVAQGETGVTTSTPLYGQTNPTGNASSTFIAPEIIETPATVGFNSGTEKSANVSGTTQKDTTEKPVGSSKIYSYTIENKDDNVIQKTTIENKTSVNKSEKESVAVDDKASQKETTADAEIVLPNFAYEQEADDNVGKLQRLGLKVVKQNSDGSYDAYYNNVSYKCVWDPAQKKWITQEADVFSGVKQADIQNTKLERAERILTAIKQGLHFTGDLNVCKDDDGNYYDFDKSSGVFVKRK